MAEPSVEPVETLRRVDGVLFDVDDTLVDTRAAFARALTAVAVEYLPHVPADRYGELLAHWRTDPGGYYRRYTRGETDHLTQRRLRADLMHRTFGGEPVTDESFPAWDALFWGTFEQSWSAFDDAHGVLEQLRAAGVAVGVVTNAAVALQERKLRSAEIDGLPVLVGVDTLGFGKPAPEVFLEGARLLGTDPARTAYVGDEPDVDARAAHAAGLVGVWLDRPGARRDRERAVDARAMRADGVAVLGGLAGLPGLLGL